jgi:pyruvate ferredoxin oxidoreductase beta subunit/2-oxoisovalerate ferredoxin oxidoreductase beta subunit
MKGFRFLHILAPCPTGWKSEPAEGIELVRDAVRSGLFAVYEVYGGGRTVINVEPAMSREALVQYFALQGRFRKANVDPDRAMAGIERRWRELRAHAALEE